MMTGEAVFGFDKRDNVVEAPFSIERILFQEDGRYGSQRRSRGLKPLEMHLALALAATSTQTCSSRVGTYPGPMNGPPPER
jgi:hypothetical protein